MLETYARIEFPDADRYFPTILDALEAHQLPVRREGPQRAIAGPGSEVALEIRGNRLDVTINCRDAASLNSMRYSVTSLIDFNAREAAPQIHWEGDMAGDTLPPQLQLLQVTNTEQITPRMRRIWFSGDDLTRYDTVEQLHSRLFFKRGRGIPTDWPVMTDAGQIRWPDGNAALDTRVYTVRSVDLAASRLAVDFFLGDHDGPATRWAHGAEPGDGVGFIGPAARGLVRAPFQVLAGDETGLPGIARCLEALDRGAEGVALIEIEGPQDEQELSAPDGMAVRWLWRGRVSPGTSNLLEKAFAEIDWPTDREQCAFWCGAEYGAFRSMRRAVRDLGIPASNTVAFAHWRNGMSEPDIAAAGSSAIRD
ncbi:siderophore-interacting protein [Pseudoruegeria sp. HB172150]|uniref:siderophore-interacting protein n=1 Tax=Pseudoruegeria sp. HB172150 TaxID=2721164 RepID=UPI001552A942|nr:siderophore-interacting protein [Pseudoruegeria sp. HB172150]